MLHHVHTVSVAFGRASILGDPGSVNALYRSFAAAIRLNRRVRMNATDRGFAVR